MAAVEGPRPGRLRGRGSRLAAGPVLQNIWGMSDQGLSSGCNFVTTLIVAREFSAGNLGVYTLLSLALLLTTQLQFALVTQPHNVIGASRDRESYAAYTSGTALAQLFLTGLLVVPLLGATLTARLVGWQQWTLLLALAVTILCAQPQEFCRRVLYTEDRLASAFANDIISYGVQALLVIALFWLHRLSVLSAFYAIAVTSAAAAVLGFWQIRHSLGAKPSRDALRENFAFGKWIAGAQLCYWISSQSYLYLLAALAGAAAAGEIRAMVVLLSPLAVGLLFLNSILPIRFARTLAAGNMRVLRNRLRLVWIVTGPPVLGYCLLVSVFGRPLVHAVYGERYDSAALTVLPLIALLTFLGYVSGVIGSAGMVLRMTPQIFRANAFAALVAVLFGWALILAFGAAGAAIGMTLSAALYMVLFWRSFARAADHRRPEQLAAKS